MAKSEDRTSDLAIRTNPQSYKASRDGCKTSCIFGGNGVANMVAGVDRESDLTGGTSHCSSGEPRR